MKTPNFIFLGIFICMGLSSCHQGSRTSGKKDFLGLSGRDTTTSPASNFFRYANGTWVKKTEIPPSNPAWGSFYQVRDLALEKMNAILDSCQALKAPAKGSVAQQIGDLYASAMDTDAIDQAGLTPLKADLDAIAGIKSVDGLLAVLTKFYTQGKGFLIKFSISPDDKNSQVERAHFDQGGLGLPNRNYYFDKDSASMGIRKAYGIYVQRILSLIGDSLHAASGAAAVIALETKLAAASKAPADLRDPLANYHLVSLAAMEKQAPNLRWKQLTSQLRVKTDTFQVGQPAFYKAVSSLLKSTDLDTWKGYLRYHLASNYAPWLSTPFREAYFAFYKKTLNGQLQPEQRWKQASYLVDRALGEALGQLYVKRYFPPQAKEYMTKLVDNLQDTYRDRLSHNGWMSDSTKVKAIEKLNAFIKKIGYPDKWKDYSSIDVNRGSVIGNLQRIGMWKYDYNIHKLGRPVDKNEWSMTPPTVNAYYDPSFNEIVFPAGILQPPFYFQHGDDAVNYGAIAAVIGHEMTHGFDDQGSHYDKDGNLRNWWTAVDREAFDKRADQVVRQYGAYAVLDDLHLNGKLTEGENIADIGGLAIAYAAFKRTPEGQSNEKVDGLTPDQRFFLSFAHIWRIKVRPERLRWQVSNDPHSPAIFRVNGPTSNMTAFYQAFDVKPGDAMYRPDSVRVHIW